MGVAPTTVCLQGSLATKRYMRPQLEARIVKRRRRVLYTGGITVPMAVAKGTAPFLLFTQISFQD
jgi:hypothetical protein